MEKKPADRPAIDRFRHFARICIEQGYTLPQMTLLLTDEMERQTPLGKRIYAGVCGEKWVEVKISPWQLKKLDVDEDDITMGQF